MTPSELLELAFSYLGDFGISVENTPRSVLYARMSMRQRELFTWASTIDPDFYGECVLGVLDNGGVDLNLLEQEEAIYPIESIQIIRIEDPGTDERYQRGDRVRIVRTDDTRELPPRATLRSKILRSVGDDLTNVVSVMIWFSRRPRPINPDGSGTVELMDPFSHLLAFDVAKYILQRDPELAGAAANAHLEALEAASLASFEAHIRGSYRALEARFG